MTRNSPAALFSLALVVLATGVVTIITLLSATQPLAAQTAPAAPFAKPPQADFPVSTVVDAAQVKGDVKPFYRFFGADEPNYAYMKDGLKLLGDIGKLGPAQAYFRAHNLMTSGDGTPAFKWGSTNIYSEDAKGNPVYDFTIVDRIFDAYLKNGVKPYAQIGFMPEALSTHPQPYQHHFVPGGSGPGNSISTGWTYPPKSYDKWRRAGLSMGETLRGKIRQSGSRTMVLGGLERAQHRLLEGNQGGIFQAS